MQEFGNFFEFPAKLPDDDLKKIMLADMKVCGLPFVDIDMSFNNEVDVIEPDGKKATIYRSMWRAAI